MKECRKTPRRQWLRIAAWVISPLLVLGIAWLTVFHINTFTLVIELLGDSDILLEYGMPYQEAGGKVLLYSTLFWEGGRELEDVALTIHDDFAKSKTGRFSVEYQAKVLGVSAQAKRTVKIIDTEPPVITLVPHTGYMVKPGNIYEEPGFTAFDNCDGDITDRVVCTVEEELITYAVTDRSGNPAVAKRIVPDYDPLPPKLTLLGGERMTILTGTPYVELGYTAEDHDGTDLTAQVTVEGEVDWTTPGIYPIVYTVSDVSGNRTTVARKVTVDAIARPEIVKPKENTIYLTFDDGPGPYTERLLDLLDVYGVKATFFVVDADNDAMLREIVNRGHSIGIHSVSHRYDHIYASPEAFFADLYEMQNIILEATGVKTTLMRFPGGSSNEISKAYCQGIMSILTEAVQDAGFQYFDWNVLSGDAGETRKTDEIAENVINGIQGKKHAAVLQHDIYGYSVDAVEEIILWGLNNGYSFRPLEKNSPGFHQKVFN